MKKHAAPKAERGTRERGAKEPERGARERGAKEPERGPRNAGPGERERGPTERIVGFAAAQAVLASRPDDVIHIAYSREARRELSDLLREAARQRIAYREVEREELERMADTLHHEGVCMLVRARKRARLEDVTRALEQGGFALALDGVTNPHNVGALLRSAAYFGARGMLVSGEARLTPAAVRVAEGGAEHVPVCFVDDLADALIDLEEAGVRIIGADAHEGVPLGRFAWPARSVIVLGSERVGLSRDVAKCCTDAVRIVGSGDVESLNVSVAAGILMSSAAEASRRRF